MLWRRHGYCDQNSRRITVQYQRIKRISMEINIDENENCGNGYERN